MEFWIVISIVCLLLFFFSLGLLGFFWGTLFGAPFVPTAQKTVQKMIQISEEIGGKIKNKKVYDLGCGDGRLVFCASEKGADAYGIEISLPVYLLAQARNFFRFLSNKPSGKIFLGSLWNIDLKDADIIFVYLLPQMMIRFEKEIFPTLKKGCLVISHGFAMKNIPITKEIPRVDAHGKILVYKV